MLTELSRKRTALHDCCANGQFSRVSELLASHVVDVDTADELGWTALMVASSAGHFSVVKILIENGADVNAINDNGQTSLHYAASRDRAQVASALIHAGINVNARDHFGSTALHRAASKGLWEMVRLLLACNRIDVNIRDDFGNTALHLAAEEERLDVCKILLAAGADVSLLNKDSKTAMQLCRNNSVRKVLQNSQNTV